MTAAITLALVALVTLWLTQRWLIYFPERDVPAPVLVQLPTAIPIAFSTEDGLQLDGWFVRPDARPTGQTVIVFNGNGGNRADRAPLASALAAQGHAVLLFDYRGYGGNPGLPSERGLTRDARAALAALEGRDDVDPSRIVYYGESLGAAVAVRLASERPPQALILRSPFTSLVEAGEHHYPFLPVRWLLRDRYPSDALVGRLGVPLLVITAGADRIVPPEMSERLYDLAAEPKWLVTIEPADHNDPVMLAGAPLMAAIDRFLAGVRQ
jgi:fermentation-respiration switch protein FrsA (DUF1100 family)